MGVDELQRTVSGFELLVLDTMVFSYHLSNHPRYSPLTCVVLDAIESGSVSGLITTVTLVEVLTAPAQAGDRQAMRDYELYLTHFPNLRTMALDATLAREVALVRATTKLRPPDAVQIAAARLVGADGIVTNDRRWTKRVTQPQVVLLDDYA
jgi:predicted nucleic acid-binding protein